MTYNQTEKMSKTKKLILCGLFAALTCTCTMLLTIPTPTGGYIHCGDAFVLLSGILLGPISGGIASGIGSMLSDVFLGYFIYAPATLVIKFLSAACAGYLASRLRKHIMNKHSMFPILIICGVVSSLIVVLGYFLFEWLLTDNILSAAFSSIFSNLIQGIASIILSCLIYSILPKRSLLEG